MPGKNLSIPRDSLSPRQRIALNLFTVWVLASLVVFVYALFATPSPVAEETPGIAPKLPPILATPVVTGDLWWRVYMVTERGRTLKSALFSDNTTGRYVEIHTDLRNDGTRPLSMPRIALVDSRGREYEADSTLKWYVQDGRDCTYDDLPPGVPRLCSFIYEVAADATGLRAVWHGDSVTLD